MAHSLDEALRQLERVEANIARLEKIWASMEQLIPQGIAFVGAGPEGRAYDDLQRSFGEIVEALPAIGGWKITARPWELDEIAQSRLDANEIGEVEALVSIERDVQRPGEELRSYRHRFNRKRRELVRSKLTDLMREVENALAHLTAEGVRRDAPASMDGPEWTKLAEAISQIDVLLGSAAPRKGRWKDLHRHLGFAQACDLYDVAEHDWPSVRADIEAAFFDEHEPIPVEVRDLDDLVAERPAGPVTTALKWERLSDEDFERLLYCIIGDAGGYENPAWLTKTRAPDRGRDLSVTRVHQDSLGGVSRYRVIIQCKHWRSKSISVEDAAATAAQMALWEPPPVDVLIVATSGRFTTDAVDWIEKHNADRKRPVIEMWPDSHLERLLAARPHLVAEFGLR